MYHCACAQAFLAPIHPAQLGCQCGRVATAVRTAVVVGYISCLVLPFDRMVTAQIQCCSGTCTSTCVFIDIAPQRKKTHNTHTHTYAARARRGRIGWHRSGHSHPSTHMKPAFCMTSPTISFKAWLPCIDAVLVSMTARSIGNSISSVPMPRNTGKSASCTSTTRSV